MSSNNNKTPTTKEPEYFFLYDKPFLGLEPPLNILTVCIAPSLLYLLCVYVIFPAVGPRSKSAVLFVSKLRYWHNVLLCAYSGFSCYVAVTEMIKANELQFWSLNLEDMRPMLCNKPSDWFTLVNTTFIWSKVYEMLDTAFIVWLKNDNARKILEEANPKKSTRGVENEESNSGSKRLTSAVNGRETAAASSSASGEIVSVKKSEKAPSELNFLHVYHHCTTFWLFLLCADLPSSTKLGPLMNGFVHFLMYAHYAHSFPKPLVPLITISQIAQLAFVTWCWYLTATHCSEFSEFTTKHFWEYLTPYAFVPVYFIFFVKFFFERFILGALFGKGGKKSVKKE